MNSNSLEKYLRNRMLQIGIVGTLAPDDVKDLIDDAISFALVELWNARPWSFRRRQVTLTTSTESDRYELPDDFAAIATVRENASTYGEGLTYNTKDEFDRKVPYPSSHNGGTPVLYTVYADTKDNKKYIQFYPRPTVTPMYLNILTTAPPNVSGLPDSAQAALIAVAQKYLFVPGTTIFDSAFGQAEREIRELEREDSLYAEVHWKFFDDTDERIKRVRDWT